MERVKLTFEKSEHGDKVTIQKDGGFTVDDMGKLTEVVEELFNAPELEAGEPDQPQDDDLEIGGDGTGDEDSEEAATEDEPFVQRVKREAQAAVAKQKNGGGGKAAAPGATPPDGRGQVQEKLEDGTGVKADGTVDRRTLKGDSENPDPKQQTVVKRAMQTGKVKPETRA